MDFDTRDKYRGAVEEASRESRLPELTVAERVLELCAAAAEAGAPADDRLCHVGYYLVGDGRANLSRRLGCHRKIRCFYRRWVASRHSTIFFAGLGVAFTLVYAPIVLLCLRQPSPALRVILSLLFVVPASQVAVQVLNYFFTRFLPPRALPKMDFDPSGVPAEFRTLVVVPILLTDAATIRVEAEKLEIRFLGNKDPNIFFSLFSDFDDSDTPHRESDGPLLGQAVTALQALNRRYEEDRFFLFHRERQWSPSEGCYIGRERKRGKLEELHQFLENTRPKDAPQLLRAGNADRLEGIRFIITLDSDTQLPPGTARRMIGTLAHPLNRPRFDEQGHILAGTYTILQPRVSPSLPSMLASPFSRLFSDPIGIDPYTKAVSDVYQDLTGQGSYNGKGIYDLRAFSRILSGRFPEERLLSHDLIEGEHVRTGLASDIELFDEFPRTYFDSSRRQHRWIRGDWQIIDWLLPRVPLAGGRRGSNTLSAISRWKIFDNLRRSLVPMTGVLLLAAAWAASPAAGWAATLVMGAAIFFHPLSRMLNAITSRQEAAKLSPSMLAHDLLRGMADAALLPHQAWLASDAIAKALYRQFVSHRKLLHWTSAQVIRRRALSQTGSLILSLTPYAALSAIGFGAIVRWRLSDAASAAPWLLLWFVSPLLVWILNTRFRPKSRRLSLSAGDRGFLRIVARRTWRFFSECLGEPTSWLPPDNYQISFQNQMAMRTSPTNIGLGLISALAARSFGYLTIDQAVQTLSRSVQTVKKLERFNGHLLNWYDLQTLRPLEPRYVSTVDSGNLLASLYSLETGLSEQMQKPILDASVFDGLADTVTILRQTYAEEIRAGKQTRPLAPIGASAEPTAGTGDRRAAAAAPNREGYGFPGGWDSQGGCRKLGNGRLDSSIGGPSKGLDPSRRSVFSMDGNSRRGI